MESALLDHLSGTSLYAALTAAAVWAILRFLPRLSPRWRLALWSLVLLRLLLPAGLSLPWSLRTGLDSLRLMVTGSAPAAHDAEPGFEVPGSRAGFPALLATGSPESLERLLLAGWLAGSLLFAGLYRFQLSRYRRIARQAAPVSDPEVLELANRWRRRFAVRRPVTLLLGGATPYTVGLFHPRIVLPPLLLETGHRDALEPVIAHEMAHVGRLDSLWLALQNLLQAAYFFHPAVWAANRQLNAARESVCDGMVLAWRSMPAARYGRGLLAVLRAGGRAPQTAAPGMSLSGRQWKTRLRNLKGEHDMKGKRTLLPYLGASVLALLLLPMAARTPVGPAIPPIAGATAAPADDPSAALLADPLPGARLTSPFGWRLHPISKRKDFHSGVDLAAPAGTPVRAAAAGTVVKIGGERTGDQGLTVVVDHGGGRQTFYAFLAERSVTLDQAVAAGQRLGAIGAVGRSTGPHLHFQVMQGEEPIDPQPLVNWQR